MKMFLAGIAISMGLLSLPAAAAEKGTATEAVAMVKKAVALIKSDGKEKPMPLFPIRPTRNSTTGTCIFMSMT